MNQEEIPEYYLIPTLLYYDENGKAILYHELDEDCWCSPTLYYFDDGSLDYIEHKLPT